MATPEILIITLAPYLPYMMADWRPKLHADSIEPVINALATICVCEVDDVIAIALESGVDNGDKIDDTIR